MDSLWKQVHRKLQITPDEKEQGQRLLKEYENRGYLKHLNRELIDLPPAVICDFFYRLSLLHSCRSPVYRKRSSHWLSQMDITSFQIHAASASLGPGNFLKASMMLPALRTQAVQLAPFTESETEHPGRLLSHSRISTRLKHPFLNELGFSAEQQLQLFVEAAHLCGLTLGFDLSYQLSRDSEALYRRPEMFRWIELDRTQMYIPRDHQSYSHMLDHKNQQKIAEHIREHVKLLEQQNLDRREISRQLRRLGYFPVPLNQERNGSIPLFIVYDNEQQEAVFTSSSEKIGQTAFKFYNYQNDQREYNQPSLEYFSQIFPLWQKKGFDFLYLDRVINPYLDNDKINESQEEAPDPLILHTTINAAHKARSSAAVIASGSFEHMNQYLESGFTSLIDQEDPLRLDKSYMERAFRLQQELKEYNSMRKQKSSLLTRISLAEYNSPSFNQKVHLEHFCCRFMNCGNAGRRKFEMMGINDGSAGYAMALKEFRNLLWREDRGFLDHYHILEDIYEKHKNTLLKGCIKEYRLESTYAWWVITGPDEILVAMISVENDEMISPPFLEVDVDPFLQQKNMPSILEYDFSSTSGNLVLSMTGKIEALQIPYRGYRLYSIQ